MRTNIELDDELVQNLLKKTGIKTKRELVDYALRELKRKEAVKDILKLEGIFEHGGWEDPYSPEATGIPNE